MRSPSRRRSSLLQTLVLMVGLSSLYAAPAQASWWSWWRSWWNDEVITHFDYEHDDKPGPAVPEPGALLLFGAGALTVAAVIRRRQGRKHS